MDTSTIDDSNAASLILNPGDISIHHPNIIRIYDEVRLRFGLSDDFASRVLQRVERVGRLFRRGSSNDR